LAFVAFGRFAGTFRPVHASEQQRRDAAEGEIVDEWTENRAGAALDEQVRRWEVAGMVRTFEYWDFLGPILDSAGVPDVLRQVLVRALRKSPDERYGSAAQMMLDLVLARRELGSVSRTDKLLGMSRRVAAAEAAANAGTHPAAAPPESGSEGTHPSRIGPTAILPRARRPLSRAAVGALIAAVLVALAAAVVILLRARG